jgi:hypothetical protein
VILSWSAPVTEKGTSIVCSIFNPSVDHAASLLQLTSTGVLIGLLSITQKPYETVKSLYCASDLDSTNNVPAIIDDDDSLLFQKRLANELSAVISELRSF